VLPAVLILIAGSQRVVAQRFVCYTPQPGDTPANIALRVTGDAQNGRKPRLPTADSKASKLTSKADYDLILSGRRVCIAEEMVRSAQPVQIFSLQNLSTIESKFVWWVVPLLVTGLLAWTATGMYVDERASILDAMRRFGGKFIREFEAPLSQRGSPDCPIGSRFRFMPHRKRLEILLAPTNGCRYPNLSDHRKNLEYDVERVLELLADQQFVIGRVSTEGRWVVIPFQFKGILREEGTK
jgi:hypothetical protein